MYAEDVRINLHCRYGRAMVRHLYQNRCRNHVEDGNHWCRDGHSMWRGRQRGMMGLPKGHRHRLSAEKGLWLQLVLLVVESWRADEPRS